MLIGCAALLATAAVPAGAETFRAAGWVNGESPSGVFIKYFVDFAEEYSGGSLEFEGFTGGVLFPAEGEVAGLSSGVAHMSSVTSSYAPSDMPNDTVITDVSFLAEDQLALAFAATELRFLNPALQAEYDGHGIVFAGSYSQSVYNLICDFVVTGIDDFKGKKIRITTSSHGDWVRDVGGVIVSVPGGEIYTGLQRGSLDCAFGTPLFLTDYFSLIEVAESDYLLPMGSNSNGGYFFNADFWQDRTPEERRILLNAISSALAMNMAEWGAKAVSALEEAGKAGVTLVEPEPAAVEKLDAMKAHFLDGLAQTEMDKRGIEDPTPIIEGLLEGMERWKVLLADVDTTDWKALDALIQREIYSKVDVETYGMGS
ncbi:C4-dicarboxylate TRAP transporter substrate-binding protein [Mangrovicoccus ximenensis]|uniref:C4-dicarboxylate TRAP transporter substrate-binding protein n=1 Tax=Mangrovicoccus ximenensis TaxID=1911570 RepID=UPI001F2A05CE|nr:C4-dicarboxylate TRAP transporter substrate-binding protein [Mangrovicoccus ximenensis]